MAISTQADNPWRALIRGLQCTHFITLNPVVPGLRLDEALKLGDTLAKRLKDRTGLPAGKIILIPEQCSQGTWHYHGFVAVTTPEQAEYLMHEAGHMMEEAMKSQLVRKFRPNRFQGIEPRSSALIEPLGDEPDGAIYYATKYWEAQRKAETVIYV